MMQLTSRCRILQSTLVFLVSNSFYCSGENFKWSLCFRLEGLKCLNSSSGKKHAMDKDLSTLACKLNTSLNPNPSCPVTAKSHETHNQTWFSTKPNCNTSLHMPATAVSRCPINLFVSTLQGTGSVCLACLVDWSQEHSPGACSEQRGKQTSSDAGGLL